jgi:hypothetical protein
MKDLLLARFDDRDGHVGIPAFGENGGDVRESTLLRQVHEVFVHDIGGLQGVGLQATQSRHEGEVLKLDDDIEDTHSDTSCAPIGDQ